MHISLPSARGIVTVCSDSANLFRPEISDYMQAHWFFFSRVDAGGYVQPLPIRRAVEKIILCDLVYKKNVLYMLV